jgi:hypothetical protein
VVWYAKRNVLAVATMNEADKILHDHGCERGVVFWLNGTALTPQRITALDPIQRSDQ